MVLICPACGANNEDDTPSCTSCGASLVVPHLPMGSKLLGGRYTIGKVLGEGGFGITYQGADTLLRRPIAIKELFPNGAMRSGTTVIPPLSTDEQRFTEVRQNFIKEAQTLAQFNHPSIVRVLDQFEENNTAYFVMEFLKGESLSSRISNRGNLKFVEVYKIAEHVAEALGLVHQTGLLHRDIKPENILLTEDGRAVLIDFGSARQFMHNKTTKVTRMVTPGYAPLEQYASQARFGAYTDIYALGATLYHALLGEYPLEATNRVAGENLKPLPKNTPEGLRKAITQALGLRIEDRPQTTEVFLDILREGSVEGSSEPYFFLGKKYSTPKKLAYGLANNWNMALEELAGENLRQWVFRGARDLDLGIFLEDLKHEKLDLDIKLFKLINRFNSQVINYMGHAFADKTDLLKIAQEAQKSDYAKEVLKSILAKDVLSLHPQALQHGFLQLEQEWKSEIQTYNQFISQEHFNGENSHQKSVPPDKDAEAILLTAILSRSMASNLQARAKKSSTPETMKRSWFAQIDQSLPAGQLAALTLAPLATKQTAQVRFKNRLRGALAAVTAWAALNWLNLLNLYPLLTILFGIVIGGIFGVVLHISPDVDRDARHWWKIISLPIFGGGSVLFFSLSSNPLTPLLVPLILLVIFVVIGVTC